MFVVCDPPHGPVAPARQCLVPCGRKERPVTAFSDVVDDALGHNLLSVVSTLQADQLAEARQVAQCEIQTTSGKFRSCRVYSEERIVFGAQAREDAFAEQGAQ